MLVQPKVVGRELLQAQRHRLNADSPLDAEVFSQPDRQLANRDHTQHRQRPVLRCAGISHRLIRRRQDVGQVRSAHNSKEVPTFPDAPVTTMRINDSPFCAW